MDPEISIDLKSETEAEGESKNGSEILKSKGKEKSKKIHGITTFELVLFPMLGSLAFCSKLLMEGLPNVHLIGMFVMLFALVFRVKGLIPLYIFVFLTGIYAGFNVWWIPYLYIWTVLWGVTMLLPKDMPPVAQMIIYPAVCALHGLLYGTLYAPAQALLFGLNLQGTIAWIIAGLPWDLVHALGNLFAGLLVYPLKQALKRLIDSSGRRAC